MSSEARFAVPIAMIVFNRPDLTRRVFEKVAAARPETLLLVADGPRPGRAGEAERVAEVRAIVQQVDWPCRVLMNFAETNMGCRRRVASGISWVFEQVSEAIILEDDCLPAPAFLGFCRDMLERYRNDRRVFAISGTNFTNEDTEPGHYFSNFSLMWGWATWADRWQRYVEEPNDAGQVIAERWPGQVLRQLFWRKTLSRVLLPEHGTWDWQWILTVWREGGLAVRPTRNLVQNIGFGPDATHTHSAEARASKLEVFPLVMSFSDGPTDVAPDWRRDKIDEQIWAGISWKNLLAMYAPWLVDLRNRLR
ncbi:MAG: glycosyltransferase family 2 protein [Sandaracinobacter sp.]